MKRKPKEKENKLKRKKAKETKENGKKYLKKTGRGGAQTGDEGAARLNIPGGPRTVFFMPF